MTKEEDHKQKMNEEEAFNLERIVGYYSGHSLDVSTKMRYALSILLTVMALPWP